ncbi:hypothetical protein P261_02101 [Lachnospiraceae bacterium TWA4]|nr:hypothetical protein P261_02101 [Lachnospiraceae bacterium TWA4]
MERLTQILKEYKKLAIAYSGGVDSNFLYQVARQTLGNENVLAVLCEGSMMPQSEIEEAKKNLEGGQYVIIPVDVFAVDEFLHNRKDRCYHCKMNVMSTVKAEAKKRGFDYVADGNNKDDGADGVYRPGMKACEELGILSPLAQAGFTKKMIRKYSKELNISTYNKPANACLASRFPYDTLLTQEKLDLVSKAEDLFHELGIGYVRVRVHEEIARIEVEKDQFQLVLEHPELVQELKNLGFKFVTLDLAGISSGSFDK